MCVLLPPAGRRKDDRRIDRERILVKYGEGTTLRTLDPKQDSVEERKLCREKVELPMT
jgi:hypothetical protein